MTRKPWFDFRIDDVDYRLLMQRRIKKVMIICSHYDGYMLEEDGRIEDRLFDEYKSLNLSSSPTIIYANSEPEALSLIQSDSIDLVIEMLNLPDVDAFELAKKIKSIESAVPVVILTHFTREVSLRLKNEDLSHVDYVFCWLGDADLLLAIVKLLEDKLNVDADTETAGVQSILLAEDSIRFTSAYLPILYKTIFQQSQNACRDAANEHQQRLYMRGRPKILLARDYREALAFYHKYAHSLLGIITDINLRQAGLQTEKTDGGIALCKLARKSDRYLPIIFQSSDITVCTTACELEAGFVHKHSKKLASDLEHLVFNNFGFGDFIFRWPTTHQEVGRATGLASLQNIIFGIPDESLEFHAEHNHLSRWLNARSVLTLGQKFRTIRPKEFQNIHELKEFISESIRQFRTWRSLGIIGTFNANQYDECQTFARIGSGSAGGKARGLVCLSSIIKRKPVFRLFEQLDVVVPRSLLLSTSLFDEFIEQNDLYKIDYTTLSDIDIHKIFISKRLSSKLSSSLEIFARTCRNPIAVRSSSKLEDSRFQAFAGIYATYMVPVDPNNIGYTVQKLSMAVKSVYASVFYKSSRQYLKATSNILDEEKMGIIVQEVCGSYHESRFYPSLSGVARSLNFYPVAPQKASDGIVSLAFGLGKYVVDGGVCLKFSPKHPRHILQLSSPDIALRDTQKEFYALNLNWNDEINTDDCANLAKLKIAEAETDAAFLQCVSVYDRENNMLRDGAMHQGRKIVTFANILQYNKFPLIELLNTMLTEGENEMKAPVEIEFAANFDGDKQTFSFLQIRPIASSIPDVNISIENIDTGHTLIRSTSVLGNGYFDQIFDIVWVKATNFESSAAIAAEIAVLNAQLQSVGRNYILIGPGRWGSSDPWLGIPVKWHEVSEARVIVELLNENQHIEPSQGSHFFQNLSSFGVAYFSITASAQTYFKQDILKAQTPITEGRYVCHYQFINPVKTIVDGKSSTGVILLDETLR